MAGVSKHSSPVGAVPLDGGYGWLVVAAAAIVHALIIGYMKSYSVIFVQLVTNFPDLSAYQLSFIPALYNTISFMEAPLSGRLTQQYGSRRVVMCGSLIAFTALFSSVFVTNLAGLLITNGILQGIAVGLCNVPSVLIVNTYFQKRRSLASAFCMSGNAMGAFIMPILLQFLVSEFTVKGCYLIISALMLNILVCAMIYRPLLPLESTIGSDDDSFDGVKSNGRSKQSTEPVSFRRQHLLPQVIVTATSEENNSIIVEDDFTHLETDSTFNILDDKKRLRQELAMYRSDPLVGSVPNLINDKFLTSSSNKSQPITLPFAANRKLRHRSVSESKYDAESHEAMLSTRANSVCFVNKNLSRIQDIESRSTRSLGDENRHGVSMKTREPKETRDQNEDSLESVQARNEGVQVSPTVEVIENDSVVTRKNDGNFIQRTLKSFAAIFLSCFDAELLKSPKMIVIIIHTVLFAMGGPFILTYIHAHFSVEGTLDSYTVTQMLSVGALGDLTGRLSSGAIGDRGLVSISTIFFIALFTSGVSVIALPWVSSPFFLGLALCGYGMGIGSWTVHIPTVLVYNHGIEKLPASYSFHRMMIGVTSLVAPQIYGALADVTGDYRLSYGVAGSCLILTSVIQFGATLDRLPWSKGIQASESVEEESVIQF